MNIQLAKIENGIATIKYEDKTGEYVVKDSGMHKDFILALEKLQEIYDFCFDKLKHNKVIGAEYKTTEKGSFYILYGIFYVITQKKEFKLQTGALYPRPNEFFYEPYYDSFLNDMVYRNREDYPHCINGDETDLIENFFKEAELFIKGKRQKSQPDLFSSTEEDSEETESPEPSESLEDSENPEEIGEENEPEATSADIANSKAFMAMMGVKKLKASPYEDDTEGQEDLGEYEDF